MPENGNAAIERFLKSAVDAVKENRDDLVELRKEINQWRRDDAKDCEERVTSSANELHHKISGLSDIVHSRIDVVLDKMIKKDEKIVERFASMDVSLSQVLVPAKFREKVWPAVIASIVSAGVAWFITNAASG